MDLISTFDDESVYMGTLKKKIEEEEEDIYDETGLCGYCAHILENIMSDE